MASGKLTCDLFVGRCLIASFISQVQHFVKASTDGPGVFKTINEKALIYELQHCESANEFVGYYWNSH